MALITISIPDHLLELVNQQRGKTLSAKVCAALAESLGTEYEPPKRGGRRIPRDITAEEFAQVKGQGIALSKPAVTPHVRQAAKPTAPKQSTEAQDDAPLKLNMETLAQQGYPYAEMVNGAFTGRLSKNANEGLTYVGKMTLAEFQRRSGKRAFVG